MSKTAPERSVEAIDAPLSSPKPLLARWLSPPGPPAMRLYHSAGAAVMAVPGRYGVSYLLLGDGAIAVADCGSAADIEPILAALRWLERDPGEVHDVIPTHLHFDHMMGVDPLALRVGAAVTLGRVAWEHVNEGRRLRWPRRWRLLRAIPTWPMQGMPLFPVADFRGGLGFGFPWAQNHFRAPLGPALEDGQSLPGLDGWTVIETPGHSDDAICLVHAEAGWLIAGDTLRNFLGGELNPLLTDAEDYRRTKRRLGELHVRFVFPGHGPAFALPGGVQGLATLPWWMP